LYPFLQFSISIFAYSNVVKIYPLSNSSLIFPLLKDFHLVHSIILLVLRFLADWPGEEMQDVFPFHTSWFYPLGNDYLQLISMAPWEWSKPIKVDTEYG